MYATTHDPRIANTSTGQVSTDGFTTVVFPNKDATATRPIAIAKSSEAKLIVAENDVANNLDAAIRIINTLQDAAGQPHMQVRIPRPP